MMKACSSASGGVIFIPDELEQKHQAIPYGELLKDEAKSPEDEVRKPRKFGLFGRRKKQVRSDSEAA